MKIAIYAEQCIMAGQRCWDEEMVDGESDDLLIFDGTPEEIASHADSADVKSRCAGAGSDIFWGRVARCLRAALDK